MKKNITIIILFVLLLGCDTEPLEPMYSVDDYGASAEFYVSFYRLDQSFFPMKIEIKRTDLPQYVYIDTIEGDGRSIYAGRFSTEYSYDIRATINNSASKYHGKTVTKNAVVFPDSTLFRTSDFN